MEASAVNRTSLVPDTIMIREALCGASTRGPTSMTVFWLIRFLKGEFSIELCQKTVKILTELHPNLQTSFQVKGAVVNWFKLEPVLVPITVYQDDGTPNYWLSVVKTESRRPFDDPDQPAWRVAVVKGKGDTILVAVTILHAIGDGVCGGQLAVQFNEVLANLILGKNHTLQLDPASPPLEALYQKFPNQTIPAQPIQPPLPFYPCNTGFAKYAFTKSPELVQKLRLYCKQHEIKMHSTLVAALILAVKKVVNPPFETFQSLTIVSFRDAMGIPKYQFRPLFSWLAVDDVDPSSGFLKIAKFVHTNLHAQMNAGKHVENVKAAEERLAQKPTAEEMVSELRIAPNLVNLTNRQELGSKGKYPEAEAEPVLIMPEIYGVGGNAPYFGLQGPGGIGITVGITTFNDIFYSTASCLEDEKIGLGEKIGEEVLVEMENVLNDEVADKVDVK